MLIPKRVSSLLVTADLSGASAFFRELGFNRVETGDPGCLGYVAGETGLILLDRDFAARCWGDDAVAALAGRFVPYVFVEAINEVPAEGGRVLADTISFGTHELVVQTVSGPIVLAELAA